MASSQNRPGGKGSVLSRDELVQGLLGDGLSEVIARSSSGRGIAASSSSQKPKPKDVADLTQAETAALLAQQQSKPVSQTTTSRLYAVPRKEREYHKLLHEQVPSMTSVVPNNVSESLERMEALPSAVPSERLDEMPKSSPVPQSNANRSSSDDDASTSEEDAPRRRNVATSSDEEEEDAEEDRRRARLQRVRQRPRQEAVILQASSETPLEKEPRINIAPPRSASNGGASTLAPSSRDTASRKSSSSSSSDDDDDNSSSSSAEDSSTDDDDVAPTVVRPKFVPKHLRDPASSIASETAHWEAQAARDRDQAERRKQESRALVQQVVVQAQSQATSQEYYDLDGAGGNEALDEDEEDATVARDAWEVRELERILEEYEVELAREREEQERQERRRRPWRDAESTAAPTMERPSQPSAPGSKFFHRGAYYMDATEWEATDVRHRAVEYAQTPVLNDHQHRDRTQLPKVMRVKQFGRANQSKYQGLAAEDTTDRKMEILPIVRPKGK